MEKTYTNYLFDLYGTLIDIRTEERSADFYRKYAEWLRQHGLSFSWTQFREAFETAERGARKEAAGTGKYRCPEIRIEDVFRRVLRAEGYSAEEKEIAEACRAFRRISRKWIRLFPDAVPCLKRLRAAGKRLYLFSNAQAAFTRPELEASGILPLFDGVLISSEEGVMKPDPAFFETGLERFGLRKDESLMIGDEPASDIAGARAAGLDSFWLCRRENARRSGAREEECPAAYRGDTLEKIPLEPFQNRERRERENENGGKNSVVRPEGRTADDGNGAGAAMDPVLRAEHRSGVHDF